MEAKPKSEVVTIKENAKDQIKSVIEQQEEDDLFLRLYVQGSGGGIKFGMAIDRRKQEGDSQFRVDDLDVVIDKLSLPYIEGAIVDFVEEGEKSGFQITNPNADLSAIGGCGSGGGGCGCGAGGGGCGTGGGGCC